MLDYVDLKKYTAWDNAIYDIQSWLVNAKLN